WTDYKSIMIGHQLEQAFPGTLNEATNPRQLLGLALSGPALAPHGELQIYHDTWGRSGDYNNPTSPLLTEKIGQIAATGDPGLLRAFLQGVHIRVGGGGTTEDNYVL